MVTNVPFTRTEKEREQANARIDKAIAEFLEKGGKITHVPHAKFTAKPARAEKASFWQRSSSSKMTDNQDELDELDD